MSLQPLALPKVLQVPSKGSEPLFVFLIHFPNILKKIPLSWLKLMVLSDLANDGVMVIRGTKMIEPIVPSLQARDHLQIRPQLLASHQEHQQTCLLPPQEHLHTPVRYLTSVAEAFGCASIASPRPGILQQNSVGGSQQSPR